MLLKILVGMGLAVALALVLINAVRPDLFRFESVAITDEPSVRQALETRLTTLTDLSPTKLLELPEHREERAQLDGRDVLYQTTRTQPREGEIQVVLAVIVREPAGLFSRPIRVAAGGFRVRLFQVTPMTSEELSELAMNADASSFYER